MEKLRKAENYIFTNEDKITVTYKKAGLNEFSQRETVVDFVFNYNTYDKPIRSPLTSVNLEKVGNNDKVKIQQDREDYILFSNKLFKDQELNEDYYLGNSKNKTELA